VYIICGTICVIAAEAGSTVVIYTLFQMPFEKVLAPWEAVREYGAQSCEKNNAYRQHKNAAGS
jgi:hypothetical protein